MPKKATSRRGRPTIPAKDQLRTQVRIDVEDSTKRAVEREMKKAGQSRSKVIRSLVREALRARGHKLAESYDEKCDRRKES